MLLPETGPVDEKLPQCHIFTKFTRKSKRGIVIYSPNLPGFVIETLPDIHQNLLIEAMLTFFKSRHVHIEITTVFFFCLRPREFHLTANCCAKSRSEISGAAVGEVIDGMNAHAMAQFELF